MAPPLVGTASAASLAQGGPLTRELLVPFGAGAVAPASPPPGAAAHGRAARAAQDEAAERWTSTSHVERLPNGNNRLEVFTEPTFRRGASGWEPLSAELEQRGNLVHAPGSVRPLTFGASEDDLVTMDLGAGPVEVVAPDLSIERPSVEGSVVTYSAVATDTDMRFEVLPNGFREEYVLRSSSAPLVFVSDIVDPDHRLGEAVRQEDGSHLFSTVFPDGLQMSVTAPYAYEEGAGLQSADYAAVAMTVIPTPGGYRVTKALDAVWAAAAAFPVILDPTILWVPDVARGYRADGWAPWCNSIFSNPYGPFYNNDSTLRSGYTSPLSDGWSRTGTLAFLAIEMPLPPGTRVLNAQLDIAWYADAPGNGALSQYEILQYLEPRDTVQNGCRLTNGATARTGSLSTAQAANWEIGPLVQQWVNDPANNNGLIIAPAAWSNTTQDLWSSSRGPRLPALIIEYVDPVLPFVDLADQQVAGTPATCATVDPSMYRADPVNTNTGRLVESITDVDLSGEPLPLRMRRSFDSGSTQAGALGIGWTHGMETRLQYDDATGYAVVDTGSGNKIGFARQTDGTFLPDVGVTADLAQRGDGFTLSMPCTGVTFQLSGDGLLETISGEDSGYLLTAVRNAAGELTTVTDSDGKVLTFSYASGLVDRVTLQDGRYVQYGYTGGRLTSVRALSGTVSTYRYDSAGNLDQITAGDRTVTNVYDQATGRLLSQQDGEGNTTAFAWDAATQTATTTYSGGGVATDVYSGNFLIRTTDRSGAMVQFTYDGDGQIATVTDPLARVTTMTYDAVTGLLAERIGPAPQNYREAWTYAPDGRLLTATDRDGKVTTYTYTYDAGGQLETVSDPLGRTAAMTYGADGRVQSATDPRAEAADANPADFRTAFTYDDNGYPSTTTAPLGRATTPTYNAQGELTSTTDAEGGVTSLTYTDAGKLRTVTDPRGNVLGAVASNYTTTNAYNSYGELETTTNAAGGVTRYAYDRAGRCTSVTDALNRVTTFDYDADGNVLRATDPTGAVTSYTYDLGGRQTSMTTPRGNALPAGEDRVPYTWTYTYDSAGNQTRVFNPLRGPTVMTYDEYGRLVTSKTPYLSKSDSYGGLVYPSFTTRMAYDGRGNVVSTTDHNGGVTTYTYDDAGQLIASTSPRGNLPGANPAAYTTRYEYDLAGNQTAVTDPLGNRTTYRYDAAGQLTAVTDPRGNIPGADAASYTTTYGYDRAGRQTSATDPVGAVITSRYDVAGNLIAVTDPRANVTGANPATFTTAYGIDRLGRVETETAPGGAVTRVGFDALGNVLTRTDANNHTSSYTYDPANRPSTRTSPTGQVWRTAYDPDGQVSTQTDAAGSATPTAGDGTTAYQRDALGRVTLLDYSDATPDVTYTYIADGRPLTATSAGVTLQYSYGEDIDTAPGSLKYVHSYTAASTSIYTTLWYAYDSLGSLTQRGETTQSDRSTANSDTAYTYDKLGRVNSVGTGATAVTLGYDAAGNLTTLTNPAANGHTESRSYDTAGRISTVANKRGTATLSSYTQTYDPASNPATLTIVNGGTTTQTAYTYDPGGRLTKACYATTCAAATAHIAYTYDPAGNRKAETRTGVTTPGTTTYAYNDADQLQSTTLGTTVARYTYDPNGNQTAAGTRTFKYDLANRVASTNSGSTTSNYTYDPNGNRRTQVIGNTTTAYTWDLAYGLPQLVQETDAKNAVTARYTHAPGGSPLTLTTAAGTSYYHHDQLGSVSNLTNATGATQASYTYEPFGAQRTAVLASKAPANPMRYAGQYLDTTGLYNLRARLYNPTIGQFTTLDPLLDQTHTPYSYGLNSPLRYSDPSGLAAEDFFDVIAGLGTGYDQAMDALLWGGVEAIAYPDREFSQAFIDPCRTGFHENAGDVTAGLLSCVDNLNPIAQIRDGVAATYELTRAGCYYDAGRAAIPPLLQAGGIAASVAAAGGAGNLLSSRHGRPEVTAPGPASTGQLRDAQGRFAGGSGYGAAGEAQGLATWGARNGATPVTQQVLAKIPGRDDLGGRKYDGLAPTSSHGYTGIEVKSGTATRDAHQRAFDDAVNSGIPAVATLNGNSIIITRVDLERVP